MNKKEEAIVLDAKYWLETKAYIKHMARGLAITAATAGAGLLLAVLAAGCGHWPIAIICGAIQATIIVVEVKNTSKCIIKFVDGYSIFAWSSGRVFGQEEASETIEFVDKTLAKNKKKR